MAIFGGILYLPFKSGTIVFVAVLVVFTVFEGCKYDNTDQFHLFNSNSFLYYNYSTAYLGSRMQQARVKGIFKMLLNLGQFASSQLV